MDFDCFRRTNPQPLVVTPEIVSPSAAETRHASVGDEGVLTFDLSDWQTADLTAVERLVLGFELTAENPDFTFGQLTIVPSSGAAVVLAAGCLTPGRRRRYPDAGLRTGIVAAPAPTRSRWSRAAYPRRMPSAARAADDHATQSTAIHPTAIIDPQADIGRGVTVGPWCIVEGPVTLAEGVRLVANVHARGPLEIGSGTTVWPFALLGMPPQHLRPSPGTPSGVRIGANVTIREQVTVHQPWEDVGETLIDDDALVMVGSHVGHDCRVGKRATLVNNTGLSGHVHVGDGAYLSGQCVAHQFVRIGRLAMMQGQTAVSLDVPPFCLVSGRNEMTGINAVAMRRAGIDRAEITAVRRAFRLAFRSGAGRAEQISALEPLAEGSAAVREMLDFVAASTRGIVFGDGRPRPSTRAWLGRFLRGEAPLAETDADGEGSL